MKRLIILSFSVCIAFGLVIILLLSPLKLKRSNTLLEISGIVQEFDSGKNSKLLVLMGEKEYYEEVEVLEKLLHPDEWTPIRKTAEGDMVMTIEIREDYEICFYSDYVRVYDGYALLLQKNEAYYRIPQTVAENIRLYVEEQQKQMSGDEK